MQSKKHPLRLKEPFIEVLQVKTKPKRTPNRQVDFATKDHLLNYILATRHRMRRRTRRTSSGPTTTNLSKEGLEKAYLTCARCGETKYCSQFDKYKSDWPRKNKKRNYCFKCRRKENEEAYQTRKVTDTRTPSQKRQDRRKAYLKAKAEGYYEKQKELIKIAKEKYKL